MDMRAIPPAEGADAAMPAYDMLVAALLSAQAASPAARAAARPLYPDGAALVALLAGGPDWRAAARAQGGRFSRAGEGRAVNPP